MKIAFLGVAIGILLVSLVSADLYYLDEPAPVSLRHGEYMVSARLHSGNGLLARGAVGLFDRVTLGLSYGVDTVLGHGAPSFGQPLAFQVRALGLEEGSWYPSVMGGYESQGYDGWASDRFRTLPQGVYLVFAKTFWSTRTELSAGANYLPLASQPFDGHIAVREFVFPDWDLLLEYDLALNDGVMRSRFFSGLLNVGIGATLGGNLNLKLGLRDILNSRDPDVGDFGLGLNRVFDVSFQQHF